MNLNSKRIKQYDIVNVNGADMAVSNILSDQVAIHEITYIPENGGYRRIRGKRLGYSRSEITVHKIHHGNILKATDSYVGLDYKI
jgi:hypothetical protein